VDVRIGVIHISREIDLELADDLDRSKLQEEIEQSLADESRVLWLTDRRGRQVAIPAGKVAYVELGEPGESRRIGFGQ